MESRVCLWVIIYPVMIRSRSLLTLFKVNISCIFNVIFKMTINNRTCVWLDQTSVHVKVDWLRYVVSVYLVLINESTCDVLCWTADLFFCFLYWEHVVCHRLLRKSRSPALPVSNWFQSMGVSERGCFRAWVFHLRFGEERQGGAGVSQQLWQPGNEMTFKQPPVSLLMCKHFPD